MNFITPPAEMPAYSPEEQRIVVLAYRRLLRSIKVEMTTEDKRQIRAAFEMAVEAHKDQRRKNNEPYILHPIEVARICVKEIGLGPTAVIAALLHDVVEDTDISLDDIEQKFGQKMAMIVDGLTKMKDLMEVGSIQAENFKKILITLMKDVRVVLIKMADRLHNLRTIQHMPPHKQLKIASETAFIFTPLAHRLGLNNIKTEFEDICLKITDRETYDEVKHKLAETKRDRDAFVQTFIQPLKKDLAKDQIPCRVFGRAKSIYSISQKIRKQKLPFEEIYDLFAVRIVIDAPVEREKELCWRAYSIITSTYTPIPERLKDWISVPKANGYESLHTTVMGPQGRFVEVQIRSERMDQIAEKGFAAHWKYKGVSPTGDVFEQWLNRAREALEKPEENALEFVNNFKDALFQEEVYVFTPKGEMRFLPQGSTALDFAFDIHTDIGLRCKSVKVNNRIVPMSYELRNGDQITVITSSTQRPTEDWKRMVKSSKARSKIAQALREELRQIGELGREALDRKMKHLKLNLEENVDALVKFYQCKSRLELYYEIAKENKDLNEIKNLKVEGGRLLPVRADSITETVKEVIEEQDFIPQGQVNKRHFDGRAKLLIGGKDAMGLAYHFSLCCSPVPGDDIFAFVSAKGGIAIHRISCVNASHLQATYGYRVQKAEWVDSIGASFTAEIAISGMDDIGVVLRLTSAITNDLKINMRSIQLTGDEGYFEGKIGVVVYNKDQLSLLIQTLRQMEGIANVERIVGQEPTQYLPEAGGNKG